MNERVEAEFDEMVAGLLQTEFCPDWDPKLLHGCMGIASEAGEILNRYRNTMEFLGEPFSRTVTLIELSDLLHYMQMIIGVSGYTVSEVLAKFNPPPPDTPFRDEDMLTHCEYVNPVLLRGFMGLSSEAGELLNRYKKFLFYHGEPFTVDEILTMIRVLLHYIQLVSDELDSSIEEIMCINMAKLGSRYPDGYTHTKAITHQRDKKAERAAVDSVIEVFAALRQKEDIGY